ncbi:MAG: hypothetical protein OEU26_37120 [Candidatus Tectomicrobia bacterium]|nr:hypothetical protein [Candidatus Tectomicrobia bacterium]
MATNDANVFTKSVAMTDLGTAVWAGGLAALEARYALTSGTADADNVEDGDVIPDVTSWG